LKEHTAVYCLVSETYIRVGCALCAQRGTAVTSPHERCSLDLFARAFGHSFKDNPAITAAMAFDEAMAEYGGSAWTYCVAGHPHRGHQTAENVPEPLPLADFMREFCRTTTNVKTSWLMLDVQRGVPEFGNMDRVFTWLSESKLKELPEQEQIRPKSALPDMTKVVIIVINHEDGTCDVIKTYLPDQPKPVSQLTKCVVGEALVPQLRKGPHALKKAFVASLNRVLGFHVSWASVSEAKPNMERKDSKSWCPPDNELVSGVAFINDGDCPNDDGDNAQTVWILRNIREGSGTPIEGWPEIRVRRMAENKSKAVQGAEPQFFFLLPS
jgi:hypothetical protein